MTVVLSLALVLSITIDVSAQQKSGAFKVHRVKLDRKSFDPSKGESVSVSFEITHRADVTVKVYDQLGQEVWQNRLTDRNAGRQSTKWDGLASTGGRAKGSVFLYVIEAIDGQGRKAKYNPVSKSGGVQTWPQEFTNDSPGELEYVLPKTCMVRLRPNLKDGPFFGPVIEWEPKPAGRHTLAWDGKDSSGMVKLFGQHKLNLQMDCYTLPSNTIIVTGDVLPLSYDKSITDEIASQRDSVWKVNNKYLHFVHNPVSCHPPKFEVEFLDAKIENQGLPVLSGKVPVRVDIAKEDVCNLINSRFGLTVYLDGVYIHGIDELAAPATFDFDASKFSKGIHLLTFNLISYDDHIGVLTKKILIGE